MIDQVNGIVEQEIESMSKVSASDLGIDDRVHGDIWIDREKIIIKLRNDRNAQYYAGWEYVDGENRSQFGDYVSYDLSDSYFEDVVNDWSRLS